MASVQRIGHYRLGKNLGIGSFGKVRRTRARAPARPPDRRAPPECRALSPPSDAQIAPLRRARAQWPSTS